MRVTVDGRFLEAALKRGIKPKLWNEKKQRFNGRDRLSLELNDFLDDTQSRILRIHQRFIDERKEISPKTILDEFAGRMERTKMLREIFRAENEKYRQRLSPRFPKKNLYILLSDFIMICVIRVWQI